MKKTVALFLSVISLVACVPKSNPETERQMLQMLEDRDYFRLESLLDEKRSELSQSITLYIEAHLQNVFNRTEQSLETIDILLGNHSKSLSDTLLHSIFLVKYDNLHKQNRYREAAEALRIAMDNYGHTSDSIRLMRLQQVYNTVAPLKEFPPQKIHIAADVTIPVYRNRFNHVMVNVASGEQSEYFVFDTGAMLSAISESCAERMNVRILESSVDVGTSIGSHVQTKVGIADSLRIGDLLFENVAFLIMPDETLSFPQVDYVINGIIGFPVMHQMREIVIQRDESITVVANPADRNLRNLFLSGLAPHVQFEANGDTVVFLMDTGANSSNFSNRFFTANEDKIRENATLTTTRRGGGGGVIETEVYELENVQLKIGGRELTVPTITVLTENFSFAENADGLLGQDVLMYFNKLILNFEYMYLAFED